VYIDFGPTRRVNYLIARYSALAEFRAMLNGWSAKSSWNGRHFLTTLSKEKGPTFTLWLRQNDIGIDFTENEWNALPRTVPEGMGDPELSAVDAGAPVGIWRTGLIGTNRWFAPAFCGERCLRHRELD